MQNLNFMINFARAARASTGIHKEPQDPGQSTSEVTTSEIGISLINKRQREHDYKNNMHQIGEEQMSTTTSGCSVNSKRKKKNKDVEHSNLGAAVDAVACQSSPPVVNISLRKPPVIHSPPQIRKSGQVHTDAVCVSPSSGTLFTTPVVLNQDLSHDSDKLTSENNPGIRSEAAKMFKSYKDGKYEETQLKFKD